MAKKNKVLPNELTFIKHREEQIASIIGSLQEVAKFKVGDFLIAFEPANSWRKRKQLANSYGAPKKYLVVHCCKFNVPYIKEINKHGNVVGQLMSPINFNHRDNIIKNTELEFEVDPDYTDSIIMMDEENYDSSGIHRVKSETFKEITEHNKKHKIACGDQKALAAWFDANVKVGDVLYKSTVTSMTVLEIKPTAVAYKNNHRYDQNFIKVQDSKGRIKELSIYDFKWTALYTARPRSYNELKDPK